MGSKWGAGLRAAIIFLAVLAAAAGARAQTASDEGGSDAALAVRTEAGPRIDGRWDDAAWSATPPIREFRVFAPREGGDPAFSAEARVLYDDRALYVLVRAFDPHPDSVVRRLARRDTYDATADQVLLFIDSFHDRRSGYEFVVTAGGVKSDALIFDDSGEDTSWDAVWDVATAIDSMGWTAEFAIPLQQLRFADRIAPTFGLMIGRWVGRTGERASWPQYRRSRAGLASQFGTLGGLRDLTGSGSLQIIPYALARTRGIAVAGRPAALETHPSLGGDLRWLPRPNISLDATVNPDFGQVEADPAVLNLSGVEVFQAERRPFFLEGAGLLTLPLAADGSAQLFHSRRIGRRPTLAEDYGAPDSPAETTILGAGKVTARLTPTASVVVLSAVTQGEKGAARTDTPGRYLIEPRAHYGVARVQRDFRGGRSGVGIMVTRADRDAGDPVAGALMPGTAQVAAVTTQHQTTDGAYRVSAWGATSDVSGSPAAISQLQLSMVHAFQRPDDEVPFDPGRTALRGSAGSVFAGKVGGGVTRFDAMYRWIAPGFDVNELGFLTKAGVQSASASAGLKLNRSGRLAGVPYRGAGLTLGFAGDWSSGGLPYGRALTLDGTMQLQSLAQVRATVIAQLPGAYCTVSCTRGGPALVDPPRFTGTLDLTGDPRRALVPHLNVEVNRDDGGRSSGLGGQVDITWRVRSNLDLSFAAYALDARYAWYYYARFGDPANDTAHYTVAGLDLRTRSLTARANYTITPSLTLQWYGQAYVSRGAYADVRELADPRAADWSERFRPYGDTAVTARPGGLDYKQFRSNAVLRWEYRPGSALFVVWSQERNVDGTAPATPGLWPGRDLRDLFSERPSNTITVKASYRLEW